MAAHGVHIPPSEASMALKILPKHAALATKTRDSGPVRDTFEQQVKQHPPHTRFGHYEHIHPRNTTRWDSDYRLLMSSHALKAAIESLLKIRDLKLNAMVLTPQEWKLSTDLRDMLDAFHRLTQLFQRGDIPLIVEVYPAFAQLQHDLCLMRDNTTLPSVCRVAAHAAYLATCKYVTLIGECDAYTIAIVMCPDKKLHWFYSNGWPRDEVELIRQQVIETFNRRFKSSLDAASRNSPDAGRRAQTMVPPAEHIGVERFRPASRMQGSPHPGPNVDDINYYLSTSPLMLPPNMTALEYWTKE
ncbi:hypothetical protein FOMPIDRAFT_1148218, partial [Fomitopsis schrenkii]